MPEGNFVVRAMYPGELCIALDWAQREGWNPGLHDAACFYAADPRGFIIGLLDDQPVGCVSAVAYGGDYGFMGFYIVRPEYRGRGYGMQLAQAGLAYLDGRACRTIGLDGVVEQQENYSKSGFIRAHRNVRYRGERPRAIESPGELAPLQNLQFATLESYDRSCFPARRTAFLRAWISQPDSRALSLVNEGCLRGYGVIRKCYEGYKIGPLFADTRAGAAQLLQGLIAGIPEGEAFYLDVPESNSAAVELAQQFAMQPVFETARMYRGPVPEIALQKIFGITSFELG